MRGISELVEAAQTGDREAYDALLQRFQPMAYALAHRALGDHHLAQDAVQEAALEAFVHLSQLKEPEAFPGWFRQIVFRQCTRMLRRATEPWISLEADSERLLTENNPEDIAVQEEIQATVRRAVAALPKPERLVTVLFYGCRYSYTEVSTSLKIPLSTVKKRLYSARQKLRVQLQATLREAGERVPRASDAVEGAGVVLVSWWSWVIRWVQARQKAGKSGAVVVKPAA